MATGPIKSKKQVRELAGYRPKRGDLSNYALIVLCVCTALRIGDLLRIGWIDVYGEGNGAFITHITLTEQETGKKVGRKNRPRIRFGERFRCSAKPNAGTAPMFV